MPVFKDEFILGRSDKKSLSGIAETIRLDLSLQQNPHLNSGSITGKIKDASGNGISGAVILILDENFNTIARTISGNDGFYTITYLASGSGYKAYSLAPGFKLSEALIFDMTPNQLLEIDMILMPAAETWSVIAGDVHDIHGIPISSASVELYKIEENTARLISMTFSNDIGQFVLRDLVIGSYFLKINAAGYFSNFFPAEIKKQKSIIHINAELKEDLKASKGTVIGIISNNDDEPLPDADVILYRVGIDKSLVPVAYTRTNHEGIYLFVNVPQGEYMVNSNRTVIVD